MNWRARCLHYQGPADSVTHPLAQPKHWTHVKAGERNLIDPRQARDRANGLPGSDARPASAEILISTGSAGGPATAALRSAAVKPHAGSATGYVVSPPWGAPTSDQDWTSG